MLTRSTRKRSAPPPSFIKASEILKKSTEKPAKVAKLFDSEDDEILEAAMDQADREQAGPSGVNPHPGSQHSARPPPPPAKDDRLDRVLASIAGLSGKFDGVKNDFATLSGKMDNLSLIHI